MNHDNCVFFFRRETCIISLSILKLFISHFMCNALLEESVVDFSPTQVQLNWKTFIEINIGRHPIYQTPQTNWTTKITIPPTENTPRLSWVCSNITRAVWLLSLFVSVKLCTLKIRWFHIIKHFVMSHRKYLADVVFIHAICVYAKHVLVLHAFCFRSLRC